MLSAGAIGGTFVIVDEASAVLARISAEFERLDVVLKETKEALASIMLPPGINASLGRMNERLAAIGNAAEKGVFNANMALGRLDENLLAIGGVADEGAIAAGAAFGKLDTSINASIGRIQALKTEMLSMPRASAEAAAMTPMIGAPAGIRARGTGGGGHSGGGGLHVRSEGIPIPGGGSVHGSGGGLWEFIGGVALMDLVKKTTESGGELEAAKQKLRGMGGISEEEINKTVKMAQDDTRTLVGTTIAGNVTGMRELMGVMPDLATARETFPMVAKAAKTLEVLDGTPAEKSMQTLAKMIELRGGGIDPKTHELSPERFTKEADSAIKMIVASGGFINADKALGLMQQAGPMARMQEDADTFYKGIMTAVMDMSGQRAGTALTAVGRQLLGGQMTMPKAEELERLGILPPRGPETWHKAGTGVYVNPGALKGEDIIKDPLRGMPVWFKDVLVPALASKGITNNADVQQELYRAFGTETARRMAGLYIQNMAQINRDAKLYDNVNPTDYYAGITTNNYPQAIKNLGDAIQNFGQAVGGPASLAAITYLGTLSAAINKIAPVALAHPKATEDTLLAGAVAGTAAVVGGISKMITGYGIGDAVGGAGKLLPWLGGALTGFAGLGSLTSPDEQKMLDKMIADEKAKAASVAIPAMPVMSAGPGFHPGRDIRSPSTGPYSYTPASLAPNIQGSLQMLPSQVQPAITSAFASIGAAISSAIAGLASSAKAAAGAIQTGGKTTQVQSTTVLNVDGRKLSEAVGSHIITANASVNNSAAADTTSMAGWTDMQSYA